MKEKFTQVEKIIVCVFLLKPSYCDLLPIEIIKSSIPPPPPSCLTSWTSAMALSVNYESASQEFEFESRWRFCYFYISKKC